MILPPTQQIMTGRFSLETVETLSYFYNLFLSHNSNLKFEIFESMAGGYKI